MAVLGVWASESMARTLSDTTMRARHEEWMSQYERVYNDLTEKETRFRIFKANVDYIDSFNSAVGSSTYSLSVNKFADLTNEEFKSRNGFKKSSSSSARTPFRYENVTDVPSTVDWRTKGAVTPVKDQGQCGTLSCNFTEMCLVTIFLIKVVGNYTRRMLLGIFGRGGHRGNYPTQNREARFIVRTRTGRL